MIWFLVLIALIVAIMLLNRRLVRNCQNCSSAVKSTNGYICTHRTALKAPELAQIQAGHWRCPWRERRQRS